MRRPNSRLNLLRLEDRLTPASVQFIGGNLRILGSNLPDNIIVTEMAGVVNVNANGQFFGPYHVTGNIFADTGNGNDTFTLQVSTSLNGTLNISTGLGNDVVNILPLMNGAAIQGLTSINTGFGNDMVFIGNDSLSLRLTGLLDNGDVGMDLLNLRNTNVQGFLLGINTEAVQIGLSSTGGIAPVSVEGITVINNGPSTLPGSFFLNCNSTLERLVFVGGSNNDIVIFCGSPPKTIRGPFFVPAEVFGDTTLVLGTGDNSVFDNGAILDGNLTVVSSNGMDLVYFNSSAIVAGTANLYLGDGPNALAGDGSVRISGDVNYTGGNGPDIVTGSPFDTMSSFQPSIDGSLRLNMGNGDNMLTFNGRVGGMLSYIGGGGADCVSIGGTNSFFLNVQLGAGNDTFTFQMNASVGGAYIDFGFGTDTFNSNNVLITWPMTVLNL